MARAAAGDRAVRSRPLRRRAICSGRSGRRGHAQPALAVPLRRDDAGRSPPPYVVVSNHESFVDILLISHLPWEMKWLSKAELFRIPVLGWMMQLAGDIPVKRGVRPQRGRGDRPVPRGAGEPGVGHDLPRGHPVHHGRHAAVQGRRVPPGHRRRRAHPAARRARHLHRAPQARLALRALAPTCGCSSRSRRQGWDPRTFRRSGTGSATGSSRLGAIWPAARHDPRLGARGHAPRGLRLASRSTTRGRGSRSGARDAGRRGAHVSGAVPGVPRAAWDRHHAEVPRWSIGTTSRPITLTRRSAAPSASASSRITGISVPCRRSRGWTTGRPPTSSPTSDGCSSSEASNSSPTKSGRHLAMLLVGLGGVGRRRPSLLGRADLPLHGGVLRSVRSTSGGGARIGGRRGGKARLWTRCCRTPSPSPGRPAGAPGPRARRAQAG